MIQKTSRKQFIATGLATVTGLLLPAKFSYAVNQTQQPDPIKPELVKEFVSACHSKFDRVKEMLAENHLLLHVSWDWGGGDFETGIEAAGHMGDKEIADYLLGKGARYNIFIAAMYGNLEVVKNILTAQPQLLNAKGPHGFTLLHHASKGGETAKSVLDYLTGLGAKETNVGFHTKP